MSRRPVDRPPCTGELRVHDFSISLDGYGAGPDQDVDDPLGVGGEQLHEWILPPAGQRTPIDDRMRARGTEGIAPRSWPKDLRPPPLAGSRRAPEGGTSGWGGGAATVRQYLRAGLLDELHVAVVPGAPGQW
jgi:hypothetical protein